VSLCPISPSFKSWYHGIWDVSGHNLLIGMIVVNCPKEDCDGDEAYFYQLQIRSADEPMTSFFKVRFYPCIT
jgi:hypothetical protein